MFGAESKPLASKERSPARRRSAGHSEWPDAQQQSARKGEETKMPLSMALVRTRLERYGRKNEALLHFFSCYALPIFIGLASLLAVRASADVDT